MVLSRLYKHENRRCQLDLQLGSRRDSSKYSPINRSKFSPGIIYRAGLKSPQSRVIQGKITLCHTKLYLVV